MTYQIKKTFNHDTHNVHFTLPGTFASRATATRAVRKLLSKNDCYPHEYCYNIVDVRTQRNVSFVYPTGPWFAPDHGGDDLPF